MPDLYRFKMADESLSHHGIEGQKWGVKNGPPYPLDAGDHSTAEKRAMKKAVRKTKNTGPAHAADDLLEEYLGNRINSLVSLKKVQDEYDEYLDALVESQNYIKWCNNEIESMLNIPGNLDTFMKFTGKDSKEEVHKVLLEDMLTASPFHYSDLYFDTHESESNKRDTIFEKSNRAKEELKKQYEEISKDILGDSYNKHLDKDGYGRNQTYGQKCEQIIDNYVIRKSMNN